MTGDIEEPDDDVQEDEDSSEEESEETVVLSADDDELDGATAEIDVDALVAKIDAEDRDKLAREREIRKKVEALNEQRDDEFGSTYNFDLNEEL